MSRYIDADAVESALQQIEMITAMSHIELGEDDDVGEISMPMFTVRKIMMNAPSIDIVRCAECIWRDKDNQGEDYCTYVKGLADINEDSFCSYGEREGE